MAYVNLLPWRLDRDERLRRRSYWQLAGVAGSVLLVVAMIYQQLAAEVSLLKSTTNEVQLKQVALQAQVDEIALLQGSLEQLNSRIRLAEHLDATRSIAGRILQSMVAVMPAETRLTELEKVGEKLLMRGSSLTQADVASFYRALSHSTAFTDAHLTEVVSGSNDRSNKSPREHHFRLALGLTMADPPDVGATQ